MGGAAVGVPSTTLMSWCRHDVHDPAQPEEIVFAFLGFAEAPGKFADADDIDAGLGHQLGVAFPGALGIFGGAAVREDPVLGIIINAKIHNLCSRVYGRRLKA